MLGHHMRSRRSAYNEVIVDTRSWRPNLPDTVMAIFFLMRDNSPLTREQYAGGEARARDVHERFLQRYPGRRVPLVSLDTTRAEGAFSMLWPEA